MNKPVLSEISYKQAPVSPSFLLRKTRQVSERFRHPSGVRDLRHTPIEKICFIESLTLPCVAYNVYGHLDANWISRTSVSTNTLVRCITYGHLDANWISRTSVSSNTPVRCITLWENKPCASTGTGDISVKNARDDTPIRVDLDICVSNCVMVVAQF